MGFRIRKMKPLFVIFFICLVTKIQPQESVGNIFLDHPFRQFYLDIPKKFQKHSNKKIFNISININSISNTGHSNIENNGELYAPGNFTTFVSSRFSFKSKYFLIQLEPYLAKRRNIFNKFHEDKGTFNYSNNHINDLTAVENNFGLRRSFIALKYKKIGLSLGNQSEWWGPGFHNAIAASTNSPSQKTIGFQTLEEINFKQSSFFLKIFTKPYLNKNNSNIYFSGMKAQVKIKTKPIITLGFHRTYLSGNFGKQGFTKSSENWNFMDATKLVFEPLFGQSKKNLDYIIDGTPGFDEWDEILTGYIKLFFPDNMLELYVDLASDDNRANFTDLRAHWDHTLGYQIGFKKYIENKKNMVFICGEFTSTVESNTFNPIFYRGSPNTVNFYSKKIYDYFTFEGRRIGAHSGSSGDDIFFAIGVINAKYSNILGYSFERHGIKKMEFPEIKNELSFTHNRFITSKSSIFINLELEIIRNNQFINSKTSKSNLIWFGYNFHF